MQFSNLKLCWLTDIVVDFLIICLCLLVFYYLFLYLKIKRCFFLTVIKNNISILALSAAYIFELILCLWVFCYLLNNSTWGFVLKNDNFGLHIRRGSHFLGRDMRRQEPNIRTWWTNVVGRSCAQSVFLLRCAAEALQANLSTGIRLCAISDLHYRKSITDFTEAQYDCESRGVICGPNMLLGHNLVYLSNLDKAGNITDDVFLSIIRCTKWWSVIDFLLFLYQTCGVCRLSQ